MGIFNVVLNFQMHTYLQHTQRVHACCNFTSIITFYVMVMNVDNSHQANNFPNVFEMTTNQWEMDLFD